MAQEYRARLWTLESSEGTLARLGRILDCRRMAGFDEMESSCEKHWMESSPTPDG